jgi:hypothetical protein
MTPHEKYLLEGLLSAMGASPDAAKEAVDTHAKRLAEKERPAKAERDDSRIPR